MTGVFLSAPRYDWCAPLSHPFSCMLVNHGPSQQSSKEEYKPWKWGDTTHLIQRPCYQQGSLCLDPESNWTTRKPSDHCKEMQTAMVWKCLLFIRSGQNHLKRHSERRGRNKADRRDGETISGNGQAWSSPSPRGWWRSEKWRKLVVKSSGTPTTLVVEQ